MKGLLIRYLKETTPNDTDLPIVYSTETGLVKRIRENLYGSDIVILNDYDDLEKNKVLEIIQTLGSENTNEGPLDRYDGYIRKWAIDNRASDELYNVISKDYQPDITINQVLTSLKRFKSEEGATTTIRDLISMEDFHMSTYIMNNVHHNLVGKMVKCVVQASDYILIYSAVVFKMRIQFWPEMAIMAMFYYLTDVSKIIALFRLVEWRASNCYKHFASKINRLPQLTADIIVYTKKHSYKLISVGTTVVVGSLYLHRNYEIVPRVEKKDIFQPPIFDFFKIAIGGVANKAGVLTVVALSGFSKGITSETSKLIINPIKLILKDVSKTVFEGFKEILEAGHRNKK